jgi:hypothetical protein
MHPKAEIFVYYLESRPFRLDVKTDWHYTYSGMANPEDPRNERGHFLYEKVVVFTGPIETQHDALEAIEEAFSNCVYITRFKTSFYETDEIAKQVV